jgi:hypothetical protein
MADGLQRDGGLNIVRGRDWILPDFVLLEVFRDISLSKHYMRIG